MNFSEPPLPWTWLYRASRKVSNPLSGILTPPPTFQPNLLDDPLPNPGRLAAALYRPAPPIRYGETPVEGMLYTRFPVTLGKWKSPVIPAELFLTPNLL